MTVEEFEREAEELIRRNRVARREIEQSQGELARDIKEAREKMKSLHQKIEDAVGQI